MAGAGHHRHDIGNDRRIKGDILGIAAQDLFGQINQVIQTPGHLHGGNGRDYGHDDQNHVDGNATGFQAEDQGEHQHAETTGKSDTDAAHACSQPDKK